MWELGNGGGGIERECGAVLREKRGAVGRQRIKRYEGKELEEKKAIYIIILSYQYQSLLSVSLPTFLKIKEKVGKGTTGNSCSNRTST